MSDDEPSDHRPTDAPSMEDAPDPAADAREAYYRELAVEYDTKIRQLVPGYEEVMDRLAGFAAVARPGSVLDVGCGPGELTLRLAEAVPHASVTALEVAPEMVTTARRRLEPVADRASVVQADILTADREALPGRPFDLVHSNFVLHNLPGARKRRALEVIHGLLAPGGVFLWGDLIRFTDPALQEAQVERRIRHARGAGCSEELIEWNFRKEAEEDFPLTAREALDLCREVGFPAPEVTWGRDTFLVLWTRKEDPEGIPQTRSRLSP